MANKCGCCSIGFVGNGGIGFEPIGGVCDFCGCQSVVRNGRFFVYRGCKGSIEIDRDSRCFYGKLQGVDDYIAYQHDDICGLKDEFKKAVDEYFLGV